MKIKLPAILLVLFTTLSLWTTTMGFIPTPWFLPYILGILFIGFCIVYKKKVKIGNKGKKLLLMTILPYVFVFVYTLIICAFRSNVGGVGAKSVITRGLGFLLYAVIAVLVGFFSVKTIREDPVSILFGGFMVNYSFCIILSIFRIGLRSTLMGLFTHDYFAVGNVLEAHEVGLSMPLFLLYFLMKDVKHKKTKLILSLITILLTQKRIVFLCLAIVVVYYYLIKQVKKKRRLLLFSGIALLLTCYAWVFVVRTGVFWAFLQEHWINMMSRQYIWRALESVYTFSPIFPGNGSGYTSRWLAVNTYNIISSASAIVGAIHSDVLRLYIEYGFVGFGVYLYNFFVLNTKRMYKWFNPREGTLYLLITLSQVLLWVTDNVSTYYNYQVVFHAIVFSALLSTSSITANSLLKGVSLDA